MVRYKQDCDRDYVVNKLQKILDLLDSPDPFDPKVKRKVGKLWGEVRGEFMICQGFKPPSPLRKKKRRR